MDEGRLEAKHGKLDYTDSLDEEEVRLFPHTKGVDEPNPPSSDIRNGPNASDTQRDEWLLKTEPLGRRRSQRLRCHGLVGRPVGNSTDMFLTL